MDSTPKAHIATFAFPFGGHATTLLSLTRKLAASAGNTSFSFFSTSKSNSSLSSILSASAPLANLKIYDIDDGVPEDYVPSGKPQEHIELFLKATPRNFHEALEGVVKERGNVTCLITDSFLWFSGEIAEQMGVPWVSFWTSGAVSLAAHFYTGQIRRMIGTDPAAVAVRQDDLLDFIPGFSALRVRDLPEGIVFGPLDSPFSLMLHRAGEESPRASAVVVNVFEGLDRTIVDDQKSKFRSVLPVAPLSLLCPPPPEDDVHSCLSWLDRFNQHPASVVYVGFGTMATPPPAELTALAEGLEASGARYLCSLKDNAKECLPAGFLERTKDRGLLVPWAPQSEVLGHVAVGAFVTHCGWNSVVESITGGVPMICRPFFGDQRINERMVSHVWGIGVGVDGGVLTREGVMGSIKLMLRTDEGKRMREKAQALKQMAREAVRDGGSSMNSFNTLLAIISSP